MRRVGVAVTIAGSVLTAALVLSAGSAGFAAPAPSASSSGPAIPVPAAVKPTTVCTISSGSNGAVDLTGLVALKDGGYATIDGANNEWHLVVATLNDKCVRTGSKAYSPGSARDPEDLAQSADGTLWVADIGDLSLNRDTIALWKVPTKGAMSIYRFSYPDGAHDASAMVLDSDGRPIFITRKSDGPAGLYEPAAGTKLTTGATIPLTKVGQFTPEVTGTDNQFAIMGQYWVTGAAVSPDGTKVVVRTTADAYEFKVTKGDIVGAITKTKPTITPMPNPYQGAGEAITYTPDGKDFLTVAKSDSEVSILKYTPATAAAVTKAGKKAAAGPKKPSALRSWFNSLSLNEVKLMLGGVALLGAILVVIGWLGIRKSRMAYYQEHPEARKGKGGKGTPAKSARGKTTRPSAASAPVGASAGGSGGGFGPPPPPGGVYGGGGGQGGVYGSSGRPPSGGGGVYGSSGGRSPSGGGRPGGGGVYGAPPGGGGGVYGAPPGGQPPADGRPPSGGGVYGRPPGGYDPYGDDPDGDPRRR